MLRGMDADEALISSMWPPLSCLFVLILGETIYRVLIGGLATEKEFNAHDYLNVHVLRVPNQWELLPKGTDEKGATEGPLQVFAH